MFRLFIITLLLEFISIIQVSAQPEPINITFVEAQPLWEHLVWDTSYFDIGNQLTLNKYNTAQPYKCYRFNNDLVINSFCLNYNGEIYGYILEKLDIETGQILWQSYSTYYNNGLQDYYKNMYLKSNGELEMIGIMRYGQYNPPLLGYWNTGGGKSSFIRKDFDYLTGEITHTIIGHDSIGHIVPGYFNFYPVTFDSSYLALNLYGNLVNDTIKYGYDFYQLNTQHNLTDTLPISSIFFKTLDPGNYFSYGQPQFTERLDDSTLIGLIIKDKLHPAKMEAQLIWMNINNLNSIKVIKRLNIENLIPSKEMDFKYFRFKVLNNLIYISELYKENNITYTFLTCLDLNGNIVHLIPKCIVNNNIYTYISLAYASNEFDYFVGFPSKTGRKGFDILKLERNSDEFHYISSITSASLDENFALQLEVNNLYNDGLFVIGAFTEKIGPVENSALKYYCFRGSDLGMDLSTSVNQLLTGNLINIYPNPSSSIINFDFDTNFTGRIEIHDSIGNQVGNYSLFDLVKFQLSLQGSPTGVYYVTIIDEQNKKIQTTKIINDTSSH